MEGLEHPDATPERGRAIDPGFVHGDRRLRQLSRHASSGVSHRATHERRFRTLASPAIATAFRFATTGATLRVDDLRCEYLVNPLGIDARAPRLSWKLVAVRPEARSLAQSAYQIVVAPSEALLGEEKETLWDSGKVASDQSLHVAYGGKPLTSHAVCWWKVRVWDQDGNVSAWSTPARWTMGMLDPGLVGQVDRLGRRRGDRRPVRGVARPLRGSGTPAESRRSARRSAPVTFAGR